MLRVYQFLHIFAAFAVWLNAKCNTGYPRKDPYKSLKTLIEFGADRQDITWDGQSLLHIAVYENSIGCLKVLADQQPNTSCGCNECQDLIQTREDNFLLSCHGRNDLMSTDNKPIPNTRQFAEAHGFDADNICADQVPLMTYVWSKQRLHAISQPADLEHLAFANTPLMLAVKGGLCGSALTLLYYGANAREHPPLM